MHSLHDAEKRPSNDSFLNEDEQKSLIDRIEELQDNEDDLNDWEIGFLESCLERVKGRRDLSPGQHAKLETIEQELPFRFDKNTFTKYDDYGYYDVY